MKETRIKEIKIDGTSYFYPQYLGLFKRWKGFKEYMMGYYIQDVNFSKLEEAESFLAKKFHKPKIEIYIHHKFTPIT